MGANNPIWEVWNEAQLLWEWPPLEGRIKCLVSIGTGVPSLKPFQDDVFHIGTTLVAIATETEQTAEKFRREKTQLDITRWYYRFNVAHGLEDIGLEESKKRKEIAAATRRYVGSQHISNQMQACADNHPVDAVDPYTLLAVVELSAKTLLIIMKYYWDVKNAKADIERLRNEIRTFHNVFRSFRSINLPQSALLGEVVKQSLVDITMLETKLNPVTGRRMMKRAGFRAPKWPLTSKEVDDCITRLERYKTTFSQALNADQT